MTKEVKKGRRIRHVPFESDKPRERSACPKCGSILVKKRMRTHDYVCKTCNWEGESVKKVIW